MKRRRLAGVGVLLLAVLLAPRETTLASWTDAEHGTGSLTSGELLYTHSYDSKTCTSVPEGEIPDTSEFTCTGGINPAAAVPLTGTVSRTDDITAEGTLPAASVTQQVRAASCGPVKLEDRLDSANPALPRYATTFATSSGPLSGSGSVTFDGSTGYAANIVNEAQPNPALTLGSTYALGVFFKTTSTAGGALFGYALSPLSVSTTSHRILYMDTNGKVGFGYNTGNGTTGVSSTAYNDGTWHFAYITIRVVEVLVIKYVYITLYVDGTEVASVPGLQVSVSYDTGYWHLGWAPSALHSYMSGLSEHFNGSLSNFVVWNGGNAESTLKDLGSSGSQSTFNSNLGSEVTDHWQLDDSGTTTYSGQYPPGAYDACEMVNFTWGFTSPTSCAWSPQSTTDACNTLTPSTLAAFVSAGWQTIGTPSPSGTQTSTIYVSRAATYTDVYMPGLHLYTPLSFKATCSSWSNTFTWPEAGAAIIG